MQSINRAAASVCPPNEPAKARRGPFHHYVWRSCLHRGPQECVRACVHACVCVCLCACMAGTASSRRMGDSCFVPQRSSLWLIGPPALTRAPSFGFYVSFLSVLAVKWADFRVVLSWPRWETFTVLIWSRINHDGGQRNAGHRWAARDPNEPVRCTWGCLVSLTFFFFFKAMQQVLDNLKELPSGTEAKDIDLIFLRGIIESPVVRSLAKARSCPQYSTTLQSSSLVTELWSNHRDGTNVSARKPGSNKCPVSWLSRFCSMWCLKNDKMILEALRTT